MPINSLLCEITSSVLQFWVTRPYRQLLLAISSVCPKEYIRNSAQFVKLYNKQYEHDTDMVGIKSLRRARY
jgi:hypothetical protein